MPRQSTPTRVNHAGRRAWRPAPFARFPVASAPSSRYLRARSFAVLLLPLAPPPTRWKRDATRPLSRCDENRPSRRASRLLAPPAAGARAANTRQKRALCAAIVASVFFFWRDPLFTRTASRRATPCRRRKILATTKFTAVSFAAASQRFVYARVRTTVAVVGGGRWRTWCGCGRRMMDGRVCGGGAAGGGEGRA